jgi:ubiquinone biosynthesis protein COQ4
MKDEYGFNFKKLFRALKKATAHPENGLIFIAQVVRHGSGPSLKYTYKKMLETRTGGEMAFNNEEISTYIPTLCDRPEGSVGRACYEKFKEKQTYMLKISRRKTKDKVSIEAKHPYSWMARRYRDTHDIWHVLTGYPTSFDGEMCITLFSFAQTRAISWLIIGLTIFFAIGRPIGIRNVTIEKIKMAYEAYRNGKKAKFLLAEDYDKLLSENLQDARERLNIRSPRFFIDKSPNLLKL